MQVIYLVGVRIYGLLIWILSPFSDKAKKWAHGRRGLFMRVASEVDQSKGSIWFHFASLGEFEQGRPVLEALRAHRPDRAFVITFYSPSGYEIRKNTPLADHVFYLPEDTPRNARRFIRSINPEMAVFTKYEYWPFYFRALAAKGMPLYLISAIFRPNQVFFRWYGGFFRRTLRCVTHFFTQNRESLALLNQLGITHASVAGDTRFDRVVGLPKTRATIPEAESFVAGRPVLVAGSTWPADEAALAQLHRHYPDWAIIVAPHEIHEEHISAMEKLFPGSVRFSTLRQGIRDKSQESTSATEHRSPNTNHRPPTTDHRTPVLIIDNIGMLSSLYAYGLVAYIGGGFGAGIHNTLEAAAHGIPVIFGPNHQKFQEANDLLVNGGGFRIKDMDELVAVFGRLTNEEMRTAAGNAAGRYVVEHAGATRIILRHLIDE